MPWEKNLTNFEEEIKNFEANILPYYRSIIIISSSLGLIISPLAAYVTYISTPSTLKHYSYLAGYSRISLFIFSSILLLWQPVCISPMFILISQGLLQSSESYVFFILLWLLLAAGVCSAHAIGSNILYLCKISLLPCSSWHGNSKKYKGLVWFFTILVIVSNLLFGITFPDSRSAIGDYIAIYPFLSSYLASKKSFLAFNIINLPWNFKVFIYYLIVIIPLYLLIFIYLFFDYHRTRRRQQKVLTIKAQQTITALSISMKIRLIVIFSFLGFPFIFSCYCLYASLLPIYVSISICMFSMFPVVDGIVEIFSIKYYRQKVLTILTCGYLKYRK